MLLLRNDAVIGINQGEGQTAELGAFSAVGTSSEAGLTGVTLAAVTDAEGAVNENLERYLRYGFVDGANLVERELAGQHHLTESSLSEEARLINGAVVHLRAGVERNRWQSEAGQSHVLHDEGVNT